MNYDFKKGQLLFIDEKYLNIRYSGDQNKGQRPFTIISIKKYNGRKYCILLPCMSKFNSKGEQRGKSEFWIEAKNNLLTKESYVISTMPTIVNMNKLIAGIKDRKVNNYKNIILLTTREIKSLKINIYLPMFVDL